MESGRLYGGIEAGGTKFICALGSGPAQIASETRIETTSPDETLRNVIHFFRPAVIEKTVGRIGVACFGPLDLDPRSSTYGFITSTTKPGWRNTDVIGRLERELDVTVVLDTDVNGAALGELTWGAGQGFDPLLYLTIGTGIGGGFVKDGVPLKGVLHPEMGHIRVPHDLKQDPFPGACPFHGDCLEGLASGPAIAKRIGLTSEALPDDHPFWHLEAHYIALAVQDFILTLSPRKVILGGGIMQRKHLFPLIRAEVRELLNGYVQHPFVEHMDEYIVPPSLGNQAGVLGAIALAGLET
ncbi:MAG TPA: ROK family protein [Anaerolineales bacterium]